MTTYKALLIETNSHALKVVNIEKDNKELQQYYALLKCSTIDITGRAFDGRHYDIICDDEGLLKNDMIISLFENGKPSLVGNLLFTRCNYDTGETIGLTKSDIERIVRHLQPLTYQTPDGNFFNSFLLTE